MKDLYAGGVGTYSTIQENSTTTSTENLFTISNDVSVTGTTMNAIGTTGYSTTPSYMCWGTYSIQSTMRREADLSLKFTDDSVCDKEFYKKVYKLQQAIRDLGWEIESIDTNITKK